VHRLGQRHQRLAWIRPGVEVHCGPFAHPERYVGPVGHDPLDAPVRQVLNVVETRHVDRLGAGQPQQQLVPAAGAALRLPLTHDHGDLADRLLAVAEHRRVDELGDRLRIERGVPAGDHHRIGLAALGRAQRNAGEIQRGQQVCVPQLGGE
jgi:hypothetical protein